MWDRLFIGARLATMGAGAAYGLVEDGALAIHEGRIVYAGPRGALPGPPDKLARKVEDVGGGLVTPGLIDCHTHLVFAGDRAREFEMRLEGASYEEIARAGGGILSTVKATRAASLDQLIDLATGRLAHMAACGVVTTEIKSGYGLEAETELKMLRAATRAGAATGVRVQRTFLAMHALPPEFKDDRHGYVRLVVEEILPAAHAEGLVDAVDAFCEGIGFTPDEVRRLFEKARSLGLPVKLHAEQLSDLGGAGLAASFGALSADHLEYLNARDIDAMAKHDTVAVLLPGAFYFLRETTKPPVALLRAQKVPIAIGSDFNPGSSPVSSPTLVMNMATTLFELTPEEALFGMTRNAALALGLADETGTLETGKSADFAVWRVHQPAELSYWVGGLKPERVYVRGEELPRNEPGRVGYS